MTICLNKLRHRRYELKATRQNTFDRGSVSLEPKKKKKLYKHWIISFDKGNGNGNENGNGNGCW